MVPMSKVIPLSIKLLFSRIHPSTLCEPTFTRVHPTAQFVIRFVILMRKSDGVEVGTLFVLVVFDTSRVGDAMGWNGVGSVRPQAEP